MKPKTNKIKMIQSKESNAIWDSLTVQMAPIIP